VKIRGEVGKLGGKEKRRLVLTCGGLVWRLVGLGVEDKFGWVGKPSLGPDLRGAQRLRGEVGLCG